jgi:hypothetical protein
MENITPEETISSKPLFDAKFTISVIAVIFFILVYIWYTKTDTTQKLTLDQRIGTLKQLRDDKATHLKNIENEQKSIYLIDQKIIPLKCGVYSEVQAKQQWELECSDFYEEQQSKIKSQSWSEDIAPSKKEDLSDE